MNKYLLYEIRIIIFVNGIIYILNIAARKDLRYKLWIVVITMAVPTP